MFHKLKDTFNLAARRLRSIAVLAWRIGWVRLRFFVLVGVIVIVVAQWDLLLTYLSKWTRGGAKVDISVQPVSGDTEYFCPMDPGVVSDWPSVCGVCNMTLVRRKRGDAAPLPEGVVARMQISPYRLYLAGVQTEAAAYRALAREVEAPGRVLSAADAGNPARIEVDMFASDADLLRNQSNARLQINRQDSRLLGLAESRNEGRTNQFVIEVDDPTNRFRARELVSCAFAFPIAEAEPFCSMPSNPPARATDEPRAIYTCPDHPAVIELSPRRCPKDDQALHRVVLAEDQRLRWWCPMHPHVTSETPDAVCDACNGMKLVARLIHFRPQGEVLAIPESSVVDTGRRQLVYVERMPGLFEAVEVTLGPRCGNAFPVIAGLEPGQRVVAQGAFLVDAESRLNPSVAVGYFGATPQGRAIPEVVQTAPSSESQLLAADNALIDAQRTCPVTGKPLGSMGAPVRVEIAGQVLFLCCDGCEASVRDHPEKYLKTPANATRAKATVNKQGTP